MSIAMNNGSVDDTLQTCINNSQILVVGAGGIGCELLKNLVLTGFKNIHVIDLDTIELSNLNRQFLFRKKHIGKPKAVVAKESVQKFNPSANIVAYHDSILNSKYNVDFYRQYALVANALDNIGARTHVNRLCLAADVPLVESGSSGYLGYMAIHKKHISECYECNTRQKPKTFPACTIRNTPSEPVHCVVWAKYLFNQLFGEADADENVSPDLSDPDGGLQSDDNAGNVVRINTREWAKECNYDPKQIFEKLFGKDIEHLNTMHDLWENRKRPKLLKWDELPDEVPQSSMHVEETLRDRQMWSPKQCQDIFSNSITALKERMLSGETEILSWDKDDEVAMEFVASAANLRSHCFHIESKTKFDLKSIAGNIVPAIAATNAVVAGLIVLQILKILEGDFSKCKSAYLGKDAKAGLRLVGSADLVKPNLNCVACGHNIPEVNVKLNEKTLTMKTFHDKIAKEGLHMVMPDIMMDKQILLSSDPEDNAEDAFDKTLGNYGAIHGSTLFCEDFTQDIRFNIIILSSTDFKDQEFEIITSDSESALDASPSTSKESAKRGHEEVSESNTSLKESADISTDGIEEVSNTEDNSTEPPAKRAKISET